MDQKELKQKVATKLSFKPHIKNIVQPYVDDTVNYAIIAALYSIYDREGDIDR